MSSLGVKMKIFKLKVDWSGTHGGYILLGIDEMEGTHISDIGSVKVKESTFSYLGEFKAIKWACLKTTNLRGNIKPDLCTDNLAVCTKLRMEDLKPNNKRIIKIWGWLLVDANDLVSYFVHGFQNVGANMLSRLVVGRIHKSQRVSLGNTYENVRQHLWRVD